ncbi:MAG TPA: SDR family NAD(P)-dependent oxidoreductase [Anaeromyxobacteraceae bacterium]|nr:SDR family NAD(P)-dependent oxidoreductase [Anaeromyxobacteraceae bacterium]
MRGVTGLVWRREEVPRMVLTGATGRLGRVLVRRFAAAGYRLFLAGRSQAALDDLLEALPVPPSGRHVAIVADLEQPRAGFALGKSVLELVDGGPVNVLHLACPPVVNEEQLCNTDGLDRMVRVNATALLEIGEALLPYMLSAQRGIIVGVLTEAMRTPLVGCWPSYVVAKTALLGVLNVLAHHARDANVRVVGLVPGALDFADNPLPAGMTPLKQVRCDPERLADALLADLADASRLPNGHYHLVSALRDERGSMATLVEPTPWSFRKGTAFGGGEGAGEDTAVSGLDEESFEILSRTFRRTFGLDPDVDVRALATHDVSAWDSLGHLKLMMNVEHALSVTIPAGRLGGISNFEALEQAVVEALGVM